MRSVRSAFPADVSRIWQLVCELAEYERLSQSVIGDAKALERDLFAPSPACACIVAEAGDQDNREIVGYALTFRTYSTFRTQPGVWLEDLYVTPAHRGHGWGKALIEEVVAQARTQGAGRVEWSVLDWNASAIGFYERLGAMVLPDWRICRVSLA